MTDPNHHFAFQVPLTTLSPTTFATPDYCRLDKKAMDNNCKKNGKKSDKANGNLKIRRVRVPDKPNISLNLWSVIKSFIGKDLTKVPLPVNFNEPLSMLQR